MLWSNEELDASWCAWFSADEAGSLEIDDHLMDGGWGGLKMALDIGFGGSLSEDARIDVDEGQVVALLFGEALRDWAASAV